MGWTVNIVHGRIGPAGGRGGLAGFFFSQGLLGLVRDQRTIADKILAWM